MNEPRPADQFHQLAKDMEKRHRKEMIRRIIAMKHKKVDTSKGGDRLYKMYGQYSTETLNKLIEEEKTK